MVTIRPTIAVTVVLEEREGYTILQFLLRFTALSYVVS